MYKKEPYLKIYWNFFQIHDVVITGTCLTVPLPCLLSGSRFLMAIPISRPGERGGRWRSRCHRGFAIASARLLPADTTRRDSSVTCHTWSGGARSRVRDTTAVSCSLPGLRAILYLFQATNWRDDCWCTLFTAGPLCHLY